MIASLSQSGTFAPLQTLSAAQKAMSATEQRLSTGRAVSSPRDNGSSYVIASHIQASIADQATLRQGQLRARSVLDVTQSAVGSITDILTQMKERVLAMSDTTLSTSERQALSNDVTQMVGQIDKVVQNSTFNGINLLQASATAPPTVWARPYPGYVNSGSSATTYNAGKVSGRTDFAIDLKTVTSDSITIDWGDGQTYSSSDSFGTPNTGSDVITHIYDDSDTDHIMTYNITASGGGFTLPWLAFTPDPDKTRFAAFNGGDAIRVAHKAMSSQALGLSNLGGLTDAEKLAAVDSALSTSEIYADYYAGRQGEADMALKQNTAMSDALEKSFSDLVDADMGKEAASWQAEQVRAAMATKALGLANSAPQMLLSLFG